MKKLIDLYEQREFVGSECSKMIVTSKEKEVKDDAK